MPFGTYYTSRYMKIVVCLFGFGSEHFVRSHCVPLLRNFLFNGFFLGIVVANTDLNIASLNVRTKVEPKASQKMDRF